MKIDMVKSVSERFATWLTTKVSESQLSEIYLMLDKIENFCNKRLILEGRLLETTDLVSMKKVVDTVRSDKVFRFTYKRKLSLANAAINYYYDFLKEYHNHQKADYKHEISEITVIEDAFAEKKRMVEMPKSKHFKKVEKNKYKIEKINFNVRQQLAYTKPLAFTYFCENHTDFKNWTQLYVAVLKCLQEDYPDKFSQILNTNISGGHRIDFGDKETEKSMVASKVFSENFYVETNLSATDIVAKIRILLDMCNVDYENLEIKYARQMQSEHRASISNEKESQPVTRANFTGKSTVDLVQTDSESDAESFREWMMSNLGLTKRSAQSYELAIKSCEQLACHLNFPEVQLYGADYEMALRIKKNLERTDAYRDMNRCQYNIYSAAITKYLLFLQNMNQQNNFEDATQIEESKNIKDSNFEAFFSDERHNLLYKELKKEGISTLDELREIKLWPFMNQHQLYSTQQRLAICVELIAKLKSLEKDNKEQNSSSFEIHYNETVYKDSSPSVAFVKFLISIATKYPLKFRNLLDVEHPETGKTVVSRHYDAAKQKMTNPDAYVDANLSSEEVKLYVAWVIGRCGAIPEDYSIKENRNNYESPEKSSSEHQFIRAKTDAHMTTQGSERTTEQHKKTSALEKSSLINHYYIQEAEKYLLQCDLTGASYEDLQSKLHYTMVGTKEIVAQSPHIIEMNKRLYHEDALVDFEEGAETLEAILDKLLKKNNGIASATNLYEYACSELSMFFNDNDIKGQQSVYDLARHLFEKLEYHGKRYAFYSNMYISRPEVAANSSISIIKKYAREKGTTVSFKEIEKYLTGLGLSTGNLRGIMRIDKDPLFLVYSENEYLLSELMHIDDTFLKQVHSALRHLFMDCDGHIIPGNISESWYNLLPALPALLAWTPMLLQQLIKFYTDELEARTIIAMKSQSSNTLHAMFVEKDSWIQTFQDVVAVFLHDEMPNCDEFEAEELRGILVEAGMISGNQLIYNMPNALGGDPRFIWNSEGSHVKVRI